MNDNYTGAIMCLQAQRKLGGMLANRDTKLHAVSWKRLLPEGVEAIQSHRWQKLAEYFFKVAEWEHNRQEGLSKRKANLKQNTDFMNSQFRDVDTTRELSDSLNIGQQAASRIIQIHERAKLTSLANLKQNTAVENFPQAEGKTRDIVAKTIGLGSGTELWIARGKLSEHGGDRRSVQRDKCPVETWASYCESIGLEKRTANRWLAEYFFKVQEWGRNRELGQDKMRNPFVNSQKGHIDTTKELATKLSIGTDTASRIIQIHDNYAGAFLKRRYHQGRLAADNNSTFALASPRARAKSLFSCCKSLIMASSSLSGAAAAARSPGSSLISHSSPYFPGTCLAGSSPVLMRRRMVISDTFKAWAACLMVQPTLFLIPINRTVTLVIAPVKLNTHHLNSVLHRGSNKWFVQLLLWQVRLKTALYNGNRGGLPARGVV